jgi:hypothetical protein
MKYKKNPIYNKSIGIKRPYLWHFVISLIAAIVTTFAMLVHNYQDSLKLKCMDADYKKKNSALCKYESYALLEAFITTLLLVFVINIIAFTILGTIY